MPPTDPGLDERVHWRTEDRWLREFKAGKALADIAYQTKPWLDRASERAITDTVEDAIRRAILRQEKKKKPNAPSKRP